MRCPQTLEVGAYVLGALVPAERDAFEKHLGECAICREEVAELAVLPGLLGRLDFETAKAIAQEGEDSAALFPVGWAGPTAAPESTEDTVLVTPITVPPERWAGPTANTDADANATDPPNGKVIPLLAAAERRRARERRNRRLVTAGVGLVAACLALVIGLGAPRLLADQGPAFQDMAASASNLPIVAELALEPTSGGTRVIMKCEYVAKANRWPYKLIVVPKSGGSAEEVFDWMAGPGDKFTMTGETAIQRDNIDRVEIRKPDGSVLLTHRG
jgi:anti-sigma factor RsiW